MSEIIDIISMSEPDFLSWLHQEREREDAIKNRLGWTNYALFGALITLLCCLYSLVKEDWSVESLYYALSLTCFILGVLASALPIIAVSINKRRGIDIIRVRRLIDVSPIVFLLFLLVISLISSICYSYFYFLLLRSCFWTMSFWGIVFIIALFAIISILYNGQKLVASWKNGVIFFNDRLNYAFCFFGVFVLCTAYTNSFRCIKDISVFEFEFSIICSSIIVVLYILFQLNNKSSDYVDIDYIIDNVTYRKMKISEAYRQIEIMRLGHRPIDYLLDYAIRLEQKQTEIDKTKLELVSLQEDIQSDTNFVAKTIYNNDKIIERSIKQIAQANKINSEFREFINDLVNQKSTLFDNDFYEFIKNYKSYCIQKDSIYIELKKLMQMQKRKIHSL